MAQAQLELFVLRPVEEFVTNNRELIVEGIVRGAEIDQIAVSITTPAGVSDLEALENSLRSLTVDLGDSHLLTTLVIYPVFDGSLSLSPRIVNLSFSKDGRIFEDMGTFNCTSGMGMEHGEARAELGVDIEARFVQIDMLDGWQADKIGIRDIGFIDSHLDFVKAKVRSISVAQNLNENGEAHFRMVILLREGENNISIVAKPLAQQEFRPPVVKEGVSVAKVTYIPEIAVEEEPLILSDGYKAELTIPTGALRSEVRRISINPLDLDQIDWISYSDNARIVRNTSPVIAYEFGVRAETPFPATAKDSLDRQPPGLAVDGKPEYPSTWMSTTSALPIWLKVDLREERSIGKVIIISRIQNNVSYGPKRMSVLLSDDDVTYSEAAFCDECGDSETEIVLQETPTARYVQLLIEDGKQGNNIQINEVEFRDDEETRIVSYVQLSSFALARPAELTLFYDDADLARAGVQAEENLAIFSWNNGMQTWEMLGGRVDLSNNWVTTNLNYLSTFAIFEAVPEVTEVRWSYNPFSPNGDGIADTTTLSVNLHGEFVNQARIEIFDCSGRLIRTLVYEEAQSGYINVVWDGRDENGNYVCIGPYIYQVIIGEEVRNGVLVVAR